jgi:hypothetical protein
MPREPELKIPKDLDIKSPYALFSLFFTEDILQTISESTNKYARRKRTKFENSVIQPRTWKETNPAEIKVFLGILIYMGVHRSPRINYYFQNSSESRPLHLPQRYMTLTRFEQLKRFLHVSSPEADELRPSGSKDWWHKSLWPPHSMKPLESSIYPDQTFLWTRPWCGALDGLYTHTKCPTSLLSRDIRSLP